MKRAVVLYAILAMTFNIIEAFKTSTQILFRIVPFALAITARACSVTISNHTVILA